MALQSSRVRRGKTVEIPEKWRGKVPSNQTMSQRRREAQEEVFQRRKRLRKEYETVDSFEV